MAMSSGPACFGQELGLPPIKYFSTQDYHSGSRNWSVLSDSLGIIYAANEEALLRYDGVSWEKILLPGKQFPYWLEKDVKGNIYVGANGDFGVLRSNPKGLLIYHSMIDSISEEFKDFNVVWEIASTTRGVGFRSKKYIFHLSDDEMIAIRPPAGGTGFDVAFTVRDTIYTRVLGLGLAYVDEQGAHLIPGTELMKDKKVNVFYPYGENKMLVATRHEGLYLLDGATLTKFATEIDDYLLDNKIYDGYYLSDDNYAIATMGNGLVVINPQGKEVFRFDSSNGLGTNQTLFVRELDGQLWLGTKNGIYQISYGSSYKLIGREFGIAGQVTSILPYQGDVYVTSNNGLYRLGKANAKPMFLSVNDDPIVDCVSLFEVDDVLYMSSLEGLHSFSKSKDLELIYSRPFLNHVQPTDHAKLFIASGFYFGLRILDMTGNLPQISEIDGINRKVTQILPVAHMTYLVRTVEDIIYTVQITEQSGAFEGRVISLKTLPDNTHLIKLGGVLVLVSGSSESIYAFNGNDLIQTDQKLQLNRAISEIVRVSTFDDQNTFITYKYEQGGYYTEAVSLEQGNVVSNGPSMYTAFEPKSIYLNELNDEIWIGGSAGIVSYKVSDSPSKSSNVRVKIRQLVLNGDSVIYGNFGQSMVFPYHQNDIRISFANEISFDDGSVLYSYRLSDQSRWSDWSPDNFVHFSKMSAGNYSFEVRSTSMTGDISLPTRIEFQVRRPWYYSNLALIIYLILIAVIGFVVYWGRVKVLLHRQEELRDLVSIQTRQLGEANEELSVRATKLEHLSAFKARFFANISHDLRTPIMLLSGRIDQLKKDQSSHFSSSALDYIAKLEKDSQSLVRLTNEIKDLVEIEEGKVNLDYRRVVINSFFRRVVSLFSSAIDQKNITLSFKTELPDDLETAFDCHYLERIIYNLITNAIKYTNEGGRISVEIKSRNAGYSIHVIDNGRGISLKDQEEIFNRSFQAGNAYNVHEGLGIGLNVVKELVTLHKGEVSVNSALGEGSEFIIALPLEDSSLFEPNDDQMYTPAPIVTRKLKEDTKTIAFENQSKPLVLLVEDHPDVRDYFTTILEDTFELITTENGSQALEVLKHRSVDLVITDLMMPVMDGFEFIEGVKSNKLLENIPVMVVSARDSQEDRYRIMHLGINNILVKPFEPHELILRAKNMINDSSGTLTVKRVVNSVEDHHQSLLQRLDQSIMDHISDNNLKVATLAQELNQSERSFFRLVKKISDMSPHEYIKELKMQYAMDLIKKKKVSTLKELSACVGLKSTSELSKHFNQRFGVKPAELLK